MDTGSISRRDVLAAGAGLAVAAGSLNAHAAISPNGVPPMKDVTPFKIDVPQARLDYIKSRIKDAEWPDVPEGEPWQYGTSAAALKDLADYMVTKYDWRAREAAMNKHQHFKAKVDDYDIHFMYEKGSGSNPQPLIMTHGWPGSFVEFLKVIDRLAPAGSAKLIATWLAIRGPLSVAVSVWVCLLAQALVKASYWV